MLTFKEEGHEYKSVDFDFDIEWVSVTSFLSKFKKKFDKKPIAIKSSKNPNSKWYGLDPDDIIKIWDKENKRATTLGSWYHNQREAALIELKSIQRNGNELKVVPPTVVDGIKYAPDQKLEEGVYPELLVYLKSLGLCGQADLVTITNGKIHILDYKTNKAINQRSYVNWEGKADKMLAPISHLEDCNYIHYNLQLSLYAYMIQRNNPHLKVGKLVINHVEFEVEGENKYGYPIMKLINGEPIVKKVTPYVMPYLKKEVQALVKTLKK